MLTTKQKMTLAHWVQMGVMPVRALAGKTPVTRVRRRGLEWSLDLREGIDLSIWLLGAFEPATVNVYRRIIKPGDIVLDIGANVGAHTLHLARAVGPGGKVYAFEPTDFAMTKLKTNLSLNPELVPRVVCCQILLWDKVEDGAPRQVFASWPLSPAPESHPLHLGLQKSTDHARTSTLDAFLAEAQVTRIDFIKLDIDGFECRMLRGARESLRRLRPPILLELAPHVLDEEGSSIEELVELLKENGYRLEESGSGKPLPLDGAELRSIIVHGGSCNAIAQPRDRGNPP